MRFHVALLVVVLSLSVKAYEDTAESRYHRALRSTEVDGAIQKALDFLWQKQVSQSIILFDGWPLVFDYQGDWPQYFHITDYSFLPHVREVSPFVVSFIHHSLSTIVKEKKEALGLSDEEIERAQEMRRQAADCMRQFRTPEDEPGAGSIGFWPDDTFPWFPGPLLSFLITALIRGPILGGKRVPRNMWVYPLQLAIQSDADDTACVYSSFLDDEKIDGGPPFDIDAVISHFTDFRDIGDVPLRTDPEGIPEASGAFLTFLGYKTPGVGQYYDNDVDLAVNANVLFFLGRINKLDTPGVTETIDLMNRFFTELGLHRDPGRYCQPGVYYPNSLVFEYFVSRAYHEGGVTALLPSVNTIVADLEGSVIEQNDGTAYWDVGEPHLNTAFAILILLNAQVETPLLEKAANFLVQEQDDQGGFVDDGVFFCAKMDGGQLINWYSESFTTGMVLEALARWKIASRSQ